MFNIKSLDRHFCAFWIHLVAAVRAFNEGIILLHLLLLHVLMVCRDVNVKICKSYSYKTNEHFTVLKHIRDLFSFMSHQVHNRCALICYTQPPNKRSFLEHLLKIFRTNLSLFPFFVERFYVMYNFVLERNNKKSLELIICIEM